MNNFYFAVSLILLLNIIAGLYRVFHGPRAADRLLAAQLFGTCGVAILLLLAEGFNRPVFRNVALIQALLGVLSTVAFVRRTWVVARNSGGGEDDD